MLNKISGGILTFCPVAPPCKGQGEEEGNVAGHGDDAGDENYGVGHSGEEHGGEHTAIIGVIIDVYQLVGKLVHRLY